jgi:hypothetical protein
MFSSRYLRGVFVPLPGFSRASYLKSKVKNKGACKRFWRAEKRLRYATIFIWFRSNVKHDLFWDTLQVQNPAYGKTTMVLLVRDCVSVFQHGLRGCGTLQSASVADRVLV